jgi:glycosyltransferase involved in cell wall biosynthesis
MSAAGRPVFSVVIPTYNRAELAGQAVESVFGQTFTDHEIIVVDDGSTDDTRIALRRFENRIRYVRQDNRGAAAARNRGIAESSGELLAFLDSDDLFEPRLLEAVLRTFESYPDAGCVFSAERELDADDHPRDGVFTKRSPGRFFSPAGLISVDTRVGAGRPGVVRRSWVERLGGFDESIRCAIDCDLSIRYSFHMPMVLQPEPLVLRRMHTSGLARNRKQDAIDWIRIMGKVARDHPDFVETHRRAYRHGLGRSYVRYGRELLADGAQDPGDRREARRALRRAVRLRPFLLRAHVYLIWSIVAPTTYAGWRRQELRLLRPAERAETRDRSPSSAGPPTAGAS